MFDKFGKMDTDGLNELARNLRKEGDTQSLRALAKENGINEEWARIYAASDTEDLAEPMMAAIGKIEIEEEEIKPKEIMADWVDYLKAKCFESEEMARAIRKTDKSLKEAIAELLKWSFDNQTEIPKDVKEAADIKASRVTLGIPGMGTAKRLLQEYYLGGDEK